MLATAADYHGALDRQHRIQTGIFSAAIFTIEQQTAQQQEKHSHRKATGMPPTNLRLITPAATTASSRCHAKGAPGRAIVRELSARAKGFFRVIAAASVTIVRNAQWTVEDRCDGTLTGVGRGTATVTYLLHRRPVQQGRQGRWRAARQAALPGTAATDGCKGDPAPAGGLTAGRSNPAGSVVIGTYAWGAAILDSRTASGYLRRGGQMKICPRCGTENAEGTDFCVVCGEYLRWEPTRALEALTPPDVSAGATGRG